MDPGPWSNLNMPFYQYGKSHCKIGRKIVLSPQWDFLYVRSDIPHRRRLDLEPLTLNAYENEVLVIETRPYKAEKWFVVVFYKPPNEKDKHFATVFSELCQALQRESSHWFIMGDTNFDMNADNL